METILNFLASAIMIMAMAARGIFRFGCHLLNRGGVCRCPDCRRPLEPSGFGGNKMRCPCCEQQYMVDREE